MGVLEAMRTWQLGACKRARAREKKCRHRHKNVLREGLLETERKYRKESDREKASPKTCWSKPNRLNQHLCLCLCLCLCISNFNFNFIYIFLLA